MKKKSYFGYYCGAWAVLVALLQVAAFVPPHEALGQSRFTGAFWAGYALIMLMLAGQLLCAYMALGAGSKERLFLNLPLLTIFRSALILSVLAGGACMALPFIPAWSGVVVCALLLGFTVIAAIKAGAAAELVEQREQAVKAKTARVREWTAQAESLVGRAQNEATRAACQQVYEALRYSDPVSAPALEEIEKQIEEQLGFFGGKVQAGDGPAAQAAARELLLCIQERNRKCKANK